MGERQPGMSSHLLIPVDFSEASMLAVAAGFKIADVMGLTPVVMHVYPAMWYGDNASMDYVGEYDAGESEMLAAIEEHDIQRVAEHKFSKLRRTIKQRQLEHELQDVKFSTLLVPGIAEDEILQYCRENSPRCVVMATRDKTKKESDLIGSVTAEVLDSCQVPVFTIPDNFVPEEGGAFSRVLMFCTLDNYDIPALEYLMRTFHNPNMRIWLLPVSKRNMTEAKERLDRLYEQLSDAWPDVTFHEAEMEEKEIDGKLDGFIKENGIDLIIAPNRKSSFFSRLFRPSVPHQCLFHLDLPMLALPADK